MKAMILVLSSKECLNLLNGDLSVLARKKFPKDYVGLVYIYCRKARPYLVRGNGLVDNLTKEYDKNYIPEPKKFELYNFEDEGYSAEFYNFFNGKVVAKVWCNKVEEIIFGTTLYNDLGFFTCDLHDFDLYKQSCLTKKEMQNYLKVKPNGLSGYAIHINNLEIFDEPKDLWEFKTPMMAERYKYDLEKAYEDDYEIGTRLAEGIADPKYECANCVELTQLSEGYYGLSHAPRSGWCYVAELED